MFCQFASEKIAKSGTYKSAEHFNKTTAEQKSKSTARKCRSESKCNRGVKSMNSFNIIQQRMQFFS